MATELSPTGVVGPGVVAGVVDDYAIGTHLISGRFHFKVKKAFHTSLSFPFESEFLKKL